MNTDPDYQPARRTLDDVPSGRFFGRCTLCPVGRREAVWSAPTEREADEAGRLHLRELHRR